MKPYTFKDHTADIIAHATGESLEEAFAAAAQAMFDVITGGADIGTGLDRTLEVEAIDLEGLLVGFLSDLIVLHETRNEVYREFVVKFSGTNQLSALCRGEKFDPERHGEGTPVKGVSYHLMEIVEGSRDELSSVQVLFDI
jgi:SHS2 domain-containing protein